MGAEAGEESCAARVFRVRGMDCANEAAAIRKELAPLIGGDDRLSFDLISGRLFVHAPTGAVPDGEIFAAVRRAGLAAEPLLGRDVQPGVWWREHGRTLATVASASATATALSVDAWQSHSWLSALGFGEPTVAPAPAVTALYLVATAAGLWFVLPRAWHALRARRADMHVLMTLAIGGALAIGELLEAATVSFLFAVSLMLEQWSLGRARDAIRALLDVAPPTARKLERGGGPDLVVPVESIASGDLILIRPGDRVPLDGEVLAGHAAVDTSPITGESVPRESTPGSAVFAGCIVLDGVLTLRVTAAATDTLLAHIVRRVAEAGRRRARVERWVDRFAAVYTPAVFAIAALIAVVPALVGWTSWNDSVYRGLVLLVIGCPCALVISTPVSVVAALASAARSGVLIKGGDILEVPAHLGAVAFDKTGTVSIGELKVVEVVPRDAGSATEVLAAAAALERDSNHPIARAIRARVDVPLVADDVRTLPGLGITGTIEGREHWLGSHRLFESRCGENGELRKQAEALEARGRTVVVLGRACQVVGLIALADRVRPEARAAVEELRTLGIERIALVTGDNRATAEAIAAETGIATVEAGLLPDDKVEVVERIRSADKTRLVAFVGDGINDAPGLACADLGIAMGDGGTDAALETADVALLSGDLRRVPWLIRHSRRTARVIRANVVFALAVKAAFVVLTALGTSSLWAAISADMGASLLVIGNGLRLLKPTDWTHHG
jgi:Cd2+/Zn2+-exporting ATPase